MTAWPVAAAHNPEPVERRKVVLHTVPERTAVVRKAPAVGAADPIVVARKVIEAVRVDSIAVVVVVAHKVAAVAVVVAHMVVEAAHRAAAIADPVPAAAADLDRMT